MSAIPTDQIPAHIPPERVVDFDFCRVPGAEEDPYRAWRTLHDGPDLIWSPHYGGHWIATRADLIEEIQKDHLHFSHREFTLPRGIKPLPFPPLESDPPEHTDFRKLIKPAFMPTVVAMLEVEARKLAVELIEKLQPFGRCEFMSDFAHHLPITIFLHSMDLPLVDREKVLGWAEAALHASEPDAKKQAYGAIFAYLQKYIAQRTAQPGDDLISLIVRSEANGRKLRPEEILGMTTLLFFAGLDTVASMLGFVAMFLARSPEHRRQLIDHPGLIPNAVDELLRRHGLSNTVRLIVEDYEFHGVSLKKDEVIMVPISLHGLDERRWENAMEVDFNRKVTGHATFGNGPHRCIGSYLARIELRVFIEEWLMRIPDFDISQNDKPRTRTGIVNNVAYLPLSWPG